MAQAAVKDAKRREQKLTAEAPKTPDGRYFVVRGRLWRCANPALDDDVRARLTRELMAARREIGKMKRGGDGDLSPARAAVDRAKVALGERGPGWWTDGAPDYTRHMARNTPYADWHAGLTDELQNLGWRVRGTPRED